MSTSTSSTLTTTTSPTQSPPQPTLAPSPELVRRALHYRADDPQEIDNYSYYGCYSFGSDTDSILTAKSVSLGNLNPSLCCDVCRNVATTYSWCGVVNGNNCVCDGTTHQELVTRPASDCSTECAGASGVSCGGNSAINLYSVTTSFAPSKSITGVLSVKELPGYSYYGCYTDNKDRRVLTYGGPMKMDEPQYCCDYCAAKDPSFSWCGVEYGLDCFCDSNPLTGGMAPESECDYGCWGDPNVQCGGSLRLNLYSATATTTDAAATTTGIEASATSSASTTGGTSSSGGSSGGSSDLSGGAIAGIVIGLVAGLALAAIAAWFMWARRARKPVPAMTPRPPTELNGSEPGSHEVDAKSTVELQASNTAPTELEASPAR